MHLTKRTKVLSIVSIVIAAIAVLLIGAYFLVGGFFYAVAIDPTNNILRSRGAVGEILLPPGVVVEHTFDEHDAWFDSSGYTTVQMVSSDKRAYKLNAYKLMQTEATDNWAVLVHGYRGNALSLRYHAYYFYQMGFNVLMPDLRGHGLSEGNYIGMGWHDSTDILDWVNKAIVSSNSAANVTIFGVSMGAATTMMATGLNLPSNVKVAVSDCGYSNAYDQFSYLLKTIIELPREPIMSSSNIFTSINANYKFKEVDSIIRLKASKTPTLFMHGDLDIFVPIYMLDEVYNACAASDKRKVIISGATHAASVILNHELYWGEVQSFIGKYINVKNIV